MKIYSISHCLKTQRRMEGNHLNTLHSTIHSMVIYSVLHVLLKKGKLNNSKIALVADRVYKSSNLRND